MLTILKLSLLICTADSDIQYKMESMCLLCVELQVWLDMLSFGVQFYKPLSVFLCLVAHTVTKRSSYSNEEGHDLYFHVKVLSKSIWLLPSVESFVATSYAA